MLKVLCVLWSGLIVLFIGKTLLFLGLICGNYISFILEVSCYIWLWSSISISDEIWPGLSFILKTYFFSLIGTKFYLSTPNMFKVCEYYKDMFFLVLLYYLNLKRKSSETAFLCCRRTGLSNMSELFWRIRLWYK